MAGRRADWLSVQGERRESEGGGRAKPLRAFSRPFSESALAERSQLADYFPMEPFADKLGATKFGIMNGRGQVRLRHAIRISIGRSLQTRETLYNTACWGFGIGIFNGLQANRTDASISILLGSIVCSVCIGYLGPVPWRWRIAKQHNLLLNGILALLLGYTFFVGSYWSVAMIITPDYAFTESFARVMLRVGLWGFIYAIIGFYITTGQDIARTQNWLERQNKREKALAEQAHQVALRAQINPHFFFNALNTIAALIPVNPARAERAVELLATALRPVLMREQPLVADLQSELSVAQAYGEMEQLRLGERLSIVYTVEDAALSMKLPSLSLQPMLENAVRHGASLHAGSYTIQVRGRVVGGSLELEILNHPSGVTLSGDASPASRHVGHALHNLEERLHSTFGKQATLKVSIHGESRGARAVMLIPQEGNDHG